MLKRKGSEVLYVTAAALAAPLPLVFAAFLVGCGMRAGLPPAEPVEPPVVGQRREEEDR